MEIYSPLQNACNKEHEEIVKLLMNDSRTELNYVDQNYNENAFFIACIYGNENIIIAMLENYQIDITISNIFRDISYFIYYRVETFNVSNTHRYVNILQLFQQTSSLI